MSKNKEIRFFNQEHFEQLARLASSTYSGREIADSGYLEWEYHLNPDGKAIISIEEEDRHLNGQYLVIPRKFWDGNEIINGSLSVNTLTHPAARGKGVFPRLAEFVYEECKRRDVQLTLGFPNSASKNIFLNKLKFQKVNELGLYFLLLNPLRSAFSFVLRQGEKSGEDIFSNNDDMHSPGVSRFSFQNDSQLYETFLKKFNAPDRITTHRSIEFLKWRYMQIPIRRYSIMKECKGEEISAIAVFRMKYIYGMRCGILIDMMTDRQEESGIQLINEVKRIARSNNLDAVFFAGSTNSNEVRVVRQLTFRQLPRKLMPQSLMAILRLHTEKLSMENFPESKWFLTFGDYDIF